MQSLIELQQSEGVAVPPAEDPLGVLVGPSVDLVGGLLFRRVVENFEIEAAGILLAATRDILGQLVDPLIDF